MCVHEGKITLGLLPVKHFPNLPNPPRPKRPDVRKLDTVILSNESLLFYSVFPSLPSTELLLLLSQTPARLPACARRQFLHVVRPQRSFPPRVLPRPLPPSFEKLAAASCPYRSCRTPDGGLALCCCGTNIYSCLPLRALHPRASLAAALSPAITSHALDTRGRAFFIPRSRLPLNKSQSTWLHRPPSPPLLANVGGAHQPQSIPRI